VLDLIFVGAVIVGIAVAAIVLIAVLIPNGED
jgi:hypothetical protein